MLEGRSGFAAGRLPQSGSSKPSERKAISLFMTISAIAAVAKNNAIGKDNQIPWHLPADLAYFKRITTGHHILMGRNSYRSIGRPLPNRTNIVITRDLSFRAAGIWVAHSLEEALGIASDHGETEAFIIGGAAVYRESMDLWDKLYLTEVDLEPEGDAFFPVLDPGAWREIWREAHAPDLKNAHAYTFRILERKTGLDPQRP